MARIRHVLLALCLATAASAVAGCSFDSSLGDVTCDEEGLEDGDRVCEDGYWVATDQTEDATDTPSDTKPDATDVLPDTADTGGDTDGGDCEPTTDDETVCDQIDNDCDGEIDEGLTTDYYYDRDGDGYGDPNQRVDRCDPPAGDYVENSGDCNDDNPEVNPDIVEECAPDGSCPYCNGVDDNCDGQADEDCPCDPEVTPSQSCFTFSSGTPGEGPCREGTQQCIEGTFGECVNEVGPSDETCNGNDDDCDGEVDEGVLNTYYRDDDGDGFGRDDDTEMGCSAPNNYAAQSGDCNDDNGSINPGASETCNGEDDDCDGDTDEGVQNTYYLDDDGDGFGDPNATQQACSATGDYVDNAQDCDDGNNQINPSESEDCNGVDDNCDGTIDEGVQDTFYLDDDGDGFGDPNSTRQACSAPTGYVEDNQDCDDGDANINPDADDDDCDGVDDNCDGDIDEDGGIEFYEDADGDSYGDGGSTTTACSAPSGYVSDDTDCDDTDPTTYPGAPEICDDRDNNCVGGTDEKPESNNWCVNRSSSAPDPSKVECDNNDAPDGGPCCETSGDGDNDCEFESTCYNTDGGNPVDDDGDGNANCADPDCDGLYCAPGKVCNSNTGDCESI